MSDLIKTPQEFIRWAERHGKVFTIREGTSKPVPWVLSGPNNHSLINFLDKLFVLQLPFDVIFLDTEGLQQKIFTFEKAIGIHKNERVFQIRN